MSCIYYSVETDAGFGGKTSQPSTEGAGLWNKLCGEVWGKASRLRGVLSALTTIPCTGRGIKSAAAAVVSDEDQPAEAQPAEAAAEAAAKVAVPVAAEIEDLEQLNTTTEVDFTGGGGDGGGDGAGAGAGAGDGSLTRISFLQHAGHVEDYSLHARLLPAGAPLWQPQNKWISIVCKETFFYDSSNNNNRERDIFALNVRMTIASPYHLERMMNFIILGWDGFMDFTVHVRFIDDGPVVGRCDRHFLDNSPNQKKTLGFDRLAGGGLGIGRHAVSGTTFSFNRTRLEYVEHLPPGDPDLKEQGLTITRWTIRITTRDGVYYVAELIHD